MKCPEKGTIQAFIDGELEISERKDIENHIQTCEKCRHSFDELKSNDDFVFAKLSYYKNYSANITKKSTKNFNPINKNSSEAKNENKVMQFMYKYRKSIAAACAVLIITAGITVQPARAFISSALNIFRVESIKGFSITPMELAQIKENISKGQGNINLDKIGQIKINGGKTKPASFEEAEKTCAFPLLTDKRLKTNLKIVEPYTISFKLNVENVNKMFKMLNATELFPKNIDGKTFSADFGAQVLINYNQNEKSYKVIQATAPSIHVPDGVDIDQLFNTLADAPILPDELKTRLKSITDWKNTLYIPLVEPIEETSVHGAPAYICSLQVKKKDGSSGISSRIIWMDKGVVYGVISNTNKEDLINFANSLA